MKKIEVLAGDGIGPEVMKEAIKVLDAAQNKLGFELGHTRADACGTASVSTAAMGDAIAAAL